MLHILLILSIISWSVSKDELKGEYVSDTPINVSSDLSFLKERYSDILIYKAIEHSVAGYSVLSNRMGYLDYNEHVSGVISKNPQIVDVLLDSLSKKNKEFIFDICIWCEVYTIIDIPVRVEEVVFLEEIIYDIPQTNFLIQSFLQRKEQDWGSLSTLQLYELPYAVCNFVTKLREDERLNFYESFFKRLNAKIGSVLP